MSTEFVPTSPEDFQRSRRIEVVLSTGVRILCRRRDLYDLTYDGLVHMPLSAAVTAVFKNPYALKDVSPEDRLEARATLERIVVAAAIAPRIVLGADAPSDAIAASELGFLELSQIVGELIGVPRLGGAVEPDTFSQPVSTTDGTPAHAGEDVRPATEQLPDGRPADTLVNG